MSEAPVTKRNVLLGVLLILLVGLIWLSIISYWIVYLAGQSLDLPPTAFHLGVWAIPYYVAAGISSVSAFYSRDVRRGFCEASIISAAIYFVATISNGFMAYFATSLWARCITGVASLDTVEKVECDHNQWILYIQFIWAWLFLFLGVIGFGAFAIDAFIRFDTRGTLAQLGRKTRKAGAAVKSAAKKAAPKISPLGHPVKNGSLYGDV